MPLNTYQGGRGPNERSSIVVGRLGPIWVSRRNDRQPCRTTALEQMEPPDETNPISVTKRTQSRPPQMLSNPRLGLTPDRPQNQPGGESGISDDMGEDGRME
jgi:hypothetical protein